MYRWFALNTLKNQMTILVWFPSDSLGSKFGLWWPRDDLFFPWVSNHWANTWKHHPDFPFSFERHFHPGTFKQNRLIGIRALPFLFFHRHRYIDTCVGLKANQDATSFNWRLCLARPESNLYNPQYTLRHDGSPHNNQIRNVVYSTRGRNALDYQRTSAFFTYYNSHNWREIRNFKCLARIATHSGEAWQNYSLPYALIN